jgi:PTH1 family peptidyl-tRNA hydrolase
MIIIFGLGNPGEKFEGTRHNLGRDVVSLLQKKWDFSSWEKKKKLKAEISKGKLAKKELLLVKSLLYMNESGKVAKELIANFKSQISNFWVIQDEIDLPLGKIKIVKNRGSAGHKGVESIIQELRTKNFVRFRIGICPKISKPKNPEKFVLQKFTKEKEFVKEVIKKTVEAIEFSLKEGLEKAMSKYNK